MNKSFCVDVYKRQILYLNPLAVFVSCDNHSLNVVGINAAHVSVQAVTFLGQQKVSSPSFPVLLIDGVFLKITLKGHCDSRWSCK